MKAGLSTSVIGRGRTGIAQYVFGLVRGWAGRAEAHSLVLFVLEEDLPLFDFARDGVELVAVPEQFRPPVKNIYWHQTRLPRLARQLGLDVLHVPSYRRMLWARPCARVATIHDLAPFRLAGKYDWKRMLYGRHWAGALARRQEEIIAVSRTTAAAIGECYKAPAERVTVILNGIDHKRFSPGPGDAARFGLSGPYFLYVARLEHPGKNHWRLIEAFNRFKTKTGSPWKLALAGADWQAAEVIHRAIRQSPFASDIHCLGFVPEEDLPDLYRGASVFLYPSLYEGFGLPPIEAMACGCPVMASENGALGEVLGGAAEIVDPTSMESMALGLESLAGDDSQRATLRKAGLERARSFDWGATAEATLGIYERAAGVKPRHSAVFDSPATRKFCPQKSETI
jgi:glycosyltransferase involved in cell wall biosynthesis